MKDRFRGRLDSARARALEMCLDYRPLFEGQARRMGDEERRIWKNGSPTQDDIDRYVDAHEEDYMDEFAAKGCSGKRRRS